MSDTSNDTPVPAVALLESSKDSAGNGEFWCLLAVLGFSLTLPATRAAVPELGPVFVGAGRSVLAGLLALGVLLLRRERFPREHVKELALVSSGVIFGFPVATAVALRSVPATHATIVIGVIPIATALYAMVRSGERPSLEFWLASLAGTAAVVVFGHSQGGIDLAGADGWLLAAVVFAAYGYSEGARLAKKLGGFRVISWALVLSLPGTVTFAGLAWPERSPLDASAAALGGLAYVSLISMYLAMVAWYHGLSRGSLARASQIQLVQPILSLGWAWLLLRETIAVSTFVTAALVLACVVWARRARVAVPQPVPRAPPVVAAPASR